MLSNFQKAAREDKIKIIMKALVEHPEADLQEIKAEIAAQTNCCTKTAHEYIKIAKWRLANGIN